MEARILAFDGTIPGSGGLPKAIGGGVAAAGLAAGGFPGKGTACDGIDGEGL